MTRTTPERPVDVERLFPELARYRRTATRLHPRPGAPGARDSSVGGPMDCECGQPLEPLLTIASYECDSFNSSWVPLEDRATLEGAIGATSVLVSRDGLLYVFVCPRDPGHPHRLSLQ
nr:hypothetical protein KPHV_02990 [Kitasatospora purpeofusca]